MIDDRLLRITALEKDLNETRQAMALLQVQYGAVNKMLVDIFNYLMVKSVIENEGNRDAVIEEMRLMNKTASDADFERMVIPAIDEHIRVYNENKDNYKDKE